MKRFGFALAILLLGGAVVGWVLGAFATGDTQHTGQMLALILLNLLIGLALSFGVFALAVRALQSRLKPVTKHVRRAGIIAAVMVGLFFGALVNIRLGQTERLMFGDLSRSSHLLVSNAGDWLASIEFWFTWVTVAYLLPLMYEEWIGRRSRVVAATVTVKERIFLVVKLAFGAVVVWLLTAATMTGDWVGYPQYATETVGTREIGNVRDDSIAIIGIDIGAMSHARYLEGIRLVGEELDRQGVAVKLVVLPKDLERSSRVAGLLEQIARQGNVVFAVPPMMTEGMRPIDERWHWVQDPTQNETPFVWGVASAVPGTLSGWSWAMRFYPHAYTDYKRGDIVPDAALRVVSLFRGGADSSIGVVEGHRFVFGKYVTGLFEDGSAPVVRRLAPWKVSGGEASWRAEDDTIWYSIGNQLVTTLSDLHTNFFRGKIVVLDPGGSPGFEDKGESYGATAAVIVHQILNDVSLTPLDSWTPWVVLLVQLIAIALMVFIQPVIAAIIIFLMVIGQAFLYPWLVEHTGYVLNVMPPILTAFWSAFVLLFIRVFHERRRAEIREKKRVEDELKAAHDMQMGLMPTADPVVRGFQISGLCHPAHEVGGDFFDYVWLDERRTRLGIAIADVSGKAMKAAITAVLTSGMVYREAGAKETPKTILRKINRPMYLKTDRRMFTAMTFAVLDIPKRVLRLSNAGQAFPVLIRKGNVELLRVEGERLPLGVQEETQYQERSIRLRTGDCVILYTDGITEAMNPNGEMFGLDRFFDLLKTLDAGLSSKGVLDTLFGRVREYAGDAAQYDDMTVVVLKVLK